MTGVADACDRTRPGYSMPPNQKLLCRTRSTSPYGYAPKRPACPTMAEAAVDCMLAALVAETPLVRQVLTTTPELVVVLVFTNGPAIQANSRTLVAVAVVIVRPDAPGASVDVPVVAVSTALGWSSVT